jgi:hypothetical protein
VKTLNRLSVVFYLLRIALGLKRVSLLKKKESAQLYDLAEAFHTIPAHLARWRDEDYDTIKMNLETYCKKYPNSAARFQYLEFLKNGIFPSFSYSLSEVYRQHHPAAQLRLIGNIFTAE